LAEPFDNELQVLHMLFLGVGKNKDIVKVDYAEDINIATERIVNISLEASGGIG